MRHRISYDKIFFGAVFTLFVIGIFGTQEAMAGAPANDIDINKCVSSSEITSNCSTAEGSASSVLIASEGDTVFFKIDAVIQNVQEGGQSSVMVNDLLPSGLEYVSDNAGSYPHGISYTPGTGVWYVGEINEGGTRSLLIEAKVKSGTCGTDQKNTATLTSSDGSGDSNDSDSATVEVDEDCPPPPPTACDMFAVIGRGSPFDKQAGIGPGTLVRVTPGVDGFTLVGPGVSAVKDVGLSGLAIDSNGRMFASTVGGGPQGGQTPSRLVELDPITGEVIDLVGKIVTFGGKGVKVRDLSFQPGTNILYGIAAGNPDRLGTINTATGVGTLVGNLPSQAHWAGLAFAPDGTLYATGEQTSGKNTGPFIVKVNPLDASFSLADGSFMSLFMDGLGVNPCDGTVYGDTGAERNPGNDFTIYEINPETGETVKSADDIADPSDLDFFPQEMVMIKEVHCEDVKMGWFTVFDEGERTFLKPFECHYTFQNGLEVAVEIVDVGGEFIFTPADDCETDILGTNVNVDGQIILIDRAGNELVLNHSAKHCENPDFPLERDETPGGSGSVNGEDSTGIFEGKSGKVETHRSIALFFIPCGIGELFEDEVQEESHIAFGSSCGTIWVDFAGLGLTPGGAGTHEPPTIGKSLDGRRQVVENGICIDGQCWTVEKPYHQEFELLQMLTSPHTISNTIFCNKGVQECNYVAVGFMPIAGDFTEPTMLVSASRAFQGPWTISVNDPEDYIYDPSDDSPQDITFTSQVINDKLLGTSFTIDFKNKDTGQLKLGIQVRDDKGGIRNHYFNEGVMFMDADAYPVVEASYEKALKVEKLCIGADPDYRNSCSFAKKKEIINANAQDIVQQMIDGTYQYDQE